LYTNKKMRNTVLIIALLLLSCNNNEKVIYYKYNDVIVSRVDKDGTSTFFYGSIKNGKKGQPSIRVKYSGFDGSLDAFLRFNPDNTVEIINYGGGYFIESEERGRKMYMRKYENPELDSLLKPYQDNYQNLVRLSDATDLEDRINRENKSKVLIYRP
jgi:hypothetical protein